MDNQVEELKQLVRENTKLAKETHEMVHKLHRAAMWARTMKILWITVIVLISLGAFVYFKPYIEQVMQLYGTAQQALEQAREFGSQFTGGGGE